MGTLRNPVGVRVWRGDEIESVHAVTAAVVDGRGRMLHRHGDPARRAWLRSSAKPIQLLPLVEEGLVERFGFSQEELAVMAASHDAEPFHLEAVRSILARAGLDESFLRCGVHEPGNAAAAEELRRRGEEPSAIHNNCSGKHAGMLTLARHLDAPLAGYSRAEHPVQRLIAEILRDMAGLAALPAPAIDVPPIATAASWNALLGMPELRWTPPLSSVVST